jgi:hypothetical protein
LPSPSPGLGNYWYYLVHSELLELTLISPIAQGGGGNGEEVAGLLHRKQNHRENNIHVKFYNQLGENIT